MNKRFNCILLFVLFVFLSACSSERFDGSKTENAQQFIMDYTIFTGVESHVLSLNEGDQLSVEIVSHSGKIDLEIAMVGAEPIYVGNDASNSSFGLNITKDGDYTITATGKKAKGGISITKNRI